MTWRIDAQPLTNRWTISGVGGFGVRGDSVPTTGTHGPSCLADLVSLPADAAAEFRAQVDQWPATGELYMFEDGGFIYTAATQNAQETAQIQRYKDGQLVDTQTIDLNVGEQPGEGEDEEHIFTGTASLALSAAASLQKQANLAGNMPLALTSQAQQSKQVTFLGALPLQLGLNATLINPDQQGRYTARFDGLLHKPRFDGVLQ